MLTLSEQTVQPNTPLEVMHQSEGWSESVVLGVAKVDARSTSHLHRQGIDR